MNKKKHHQAIESQRKAKSKITWRRQVSNPLGKGKGSIHLRQNHAEAKIANHQTKTHSPCTYASSPWAKAHSPWTNAAMQHGNATCIKKLLTLPMAVRPSSPSG
jgi:hypothetical protein